MSQDSTDGRTYVIVYGDSFAGDSPRVRQLQMEALLAGHGVKRSLWHRFLRWLGIKD